MCIVLLPVCHAPAARLVSSSGEYSRLPVATIAGPKPRGEVAVEYEVDGQTLIYDRITFTTISFDRAILVHELLRSYPVGKKVNFYYKPDDPARSVLDQPLRFTAFLLPAVGALLTIGTIGAGSWSIFHRAGGDAATDR